MTFSLYAAVIPQYQQLLGSLAGLLDDADAWCRGRNVEPSSIIQSRLVADMLPFAYQVKSAAHHSAGAIAGVRSGVFRPDNETPPETFEKLRARVTQANAEINEVLPEEMEDFIGKNVTFIGRSTKLYQADRFLLSFSQPNFYFHLTTAYALLRAAGMPIGKRNFLGQLQTSGGD